MKRNFLIIATAFSLVCLTSTAIATTENDVLSLEVSAKSGNRASIRKLFELHKSTDGAVTEDIDMILGNAARTHPHIFLEELKRIRPKGSKCSNVGNTLELTDQTKEQIKELRARRRALLSVKEKSLVALRDNCVSRLDRTINTFVNVEKDAR